MMPVRIRQKPFRCLCRTSKILRLWTYVQHIQRNTHRTFLTVCLVVISSASASPCDWLLHLYSLGFPHCHLSNSIRNHSGYGLVQWEKAFHSNAFSHWSWPHREWSPGMTVPVPWSNLERQRRNWPPPIHKQNTTMCEQRVSLQWCHKGPDGFSNHQTYDCLLNRLFRRRSKKTSKSCVTGLCAGNSPGPVNSPHKGPVTRKMFPFDDVIM